MLLENGGFELNCNNVIMLGIQGMIKNRPTQAKAQEPSLHARGPTRLGAGLKLFLSRNWDLRLVALYSVALMAVTVPELKWGYDLGHDPGLLMSSVRIWAGQVPYRNFYPWYGPLYHYLLAFFVGIAGNTLYGLKAYIDVVNPLLCMLILVLILRFSGMSLSGRIFTMIAVPLFGLERIYYCGSLRSFLPVLAVAVWNRAYFSRRPQYLSLVFPCAFLLFFFSPETGVYLIPPAFFFVLLAVGSEKTRKSRLAIPAWFCAGILACAVVFAALLGRAQWFPEYLYYVRFMTGNFRWAWGMSLPALWPVESDFAQFVYSPLAIYAMAGMIMIGSWLCRKERPERFLWPATILIFGAMIWYSAAMRTSRTHLQFAFLPAVILAAMALPEKFRPVTVRLVAAGLALSAFLVIGGLYFKSDLEPGFHGADYKMFLGVRIAPDEWKVFEKAREFAKEHPNDVIAFPLSSFYYVVTGRRPDFKYDTPSWPIYPGYQRDFVRALSELNARYIIIDENDTSWLTPGEALDPVMDYVDENYEEISVERPLRIYEKRSKAASIIRGLMKDPHAHVLNRGNSFTLDFMLRDQRISSAGFLDFKAEFIYKPEFLRQFSMPMIQFYSDGKRWEYTREQCGRQRINNSPGPQSFRAYFQYPAKRIKMIVTFPGALNFPPEKIVIKDMKVLGCITKCTPRSIPYKLK